MSADTIVPDPANPQSYNRYSYVYNNPLILVDPTGHCAGVVNANDPSQAPDLDCWDFLENEFCNDNLCDNWNEWISVGGSSNWVRGELEAIRNGLLAARATLESIGLNFNGELGGTKFFRTTKEGVNAQYFKSNDRINIYDNFYSSGISGAASIDAIRTTLHELGHAIDNKHNSDGTRLSALFPGQSENELTPGGYYETWTPSSQYCYRDYGCSDKRFDPNQQRREAFADAFASFTYDHAKQNNVLSLSSDHVRNPRVTPNTDFAAIYTWMALALTR